MRKYFWIIIFISSAHIAFSQTTKENLYRTKRDSLVSALPSLQDSARVDCLNLLSSIYGSDVLGESPYQKEVDTAGIYAKQANAEAKEIGYKRGLGYSYLRIGEAIYTAGEIEYNGKYNPAYFDPIEQNGKQAIQIGETIGDNTLIGNAWFLLANLSDQKNEPNEKAVYLENMNKAISYFQKPGTQKRKGKYTELNEAVCEGCGGNEIRLGNIHIELSRYFGMQKDETSAVDHAKKALLAFEKAGDVGGLAWVYTMLANSDFRQNKKASARNNAEKSLEYVKQTGNELGLVVAYINLGQWCINWADFENGLEYSRKALAILDKISEGRKPGTTYKWHWSTAYQLMCHLYIIGGDYETALKFLENARSFYTDSSHTGYNLSWWALMGEVHRLMGHTDSAMNYLGKFENRIDQWANRYLIKLYMDLKQYDRAIQMVTARIADARKSKRSFQLGADLTLAAEINLKKNNYRIALNNLKEGLPLLTHPNGFFMIMDNYRLRAEAFHEFKENDSAYFYLKEYMSLKDSILNRQFLWKLNSYKKQVEEERKTSQINLLNKENQLKEQKLKQQTTFRNSLIIGFMLLLLLGVFISRNLLLKRKNDKLQMQKDFELQKLESEKKQAELHQRAVELEMQALRAQMNPHFIFNCLSSINRFIFKNDNKAASDYLTRFSRLIRMVLMHSQKKLIPLEDELEMIRLYLDLERLRFKDAFDYSITTTNIVDAGIIFIPPLLLQPFCENAVWHGLMHKEGRGHLNIEISEVVSEGDKTLHCVIEDDGIGREKATELKSKSAENEKSMGLKITTERLALLNQENNFDTFYKIDDILNDENEIMGTRVQLKIKYKESVEELV